jgi:Zn-dependent protease with chaperone function
VTPDEQDAWIGRLEQAAERSPGWFVVRVAAMAVLAYAVLGTVCLGLLSVGLGLGVLAVREPNAGTIKLALLLGLAALFSAGRILRSLWVKLEPPDGWAVKAKDAPELFAELRRLRRELRVGRIHRVQVTPDLNASASAVPWFGVFGGTRRHLTLGLPLLQGLSPEEFRSVLAHELGHFSRDHGGITRWLYRIRTTWLQLVDAAAERGRGFFLLGPFLRWWWPRFNGLSFVLSRRQEHEADAAASRLAGVEAAGRALLRLEILSRLVDEGFWPEVQRLAVDLPEPPGDLYARMAAFVRREPGPEAARWLREALAVPTNNADTHPCLRDRLAAMGFPGADGAEFLPDVPRVGTTAAEAWLGPLEGALQTRFSGAWADAMRGAWADRHREAAERKKALEAIGAAEAEGSLTPARKWERIEHVADVDGEEAAVPLLRELLEEEPDHAAANFLFGRILLERDDAAGIGHLERAMARDRFATPEACGLIHGYLQRKGRLEEAKALERRVYDHERLIREAREERDKVNHRTPLADHGLDGETLEAIRAVFAAHPEVFRAEIVRAVVRIMPENPYFLVAVTVRVPWWKFRSQEADQRLVNALLEALPVPGQFLIFTTKGANVAALARAVRRHAGSEVYRRG